jgi:hypothetical protein
LRLRVNSCKKSKVKKVEIVKYLPYERFSHAENESLRQLLHAKELRDNESEFLNTILEAIKILKDNGYQYDFSILNDFQYIEKLEIYVQQ